MNIELAQQKSTDCPFFSCFCGCMHILWFSEIRSLCGCMRVRACRVYSAIDAVHVLNWHQWAVCMTFLVAMIFISARKSNSLWF